MQDALALERHAAATLREADATKNALLLAASHDLTTPVAAVAALAEILQRHPDLPQGEVAHIAEGLVTTSSQLRGILSNLLDAERHPAAGTSSCRAHAHGSARSSSSAQARDLGLDEGRLTPPRPTPVDADLDVGLTARIVDNLLGNAPHHTPAGTAVRVDIAAGGGRPRADGGRPGSRRARRAPRRRSSRPSNATAVARRAGLGLGLFIVRRFAELQGGRAWVEDAPGGGATFKVAFSRGQDGRPSPERCRRYARDGPVGPPRSAGLRLLGQPQRPLADDVALDLGRAAPDGLGP